jgi:hypothetical protein
MNRTVISVTVKLAVTMALMVFGLLTAGCGSSGNQPSTNSTPNGAY